MSPRFLGRDDSDEASPAESSGPDGPHSSQEVELRDALAALGERPTAERLARLRAAAVRLDSQPGLLSAARRLRRALPGDERFGDRLSTAGEAPAQMVARSLTALRSERERESVVSEVGMAGLQLWQSLSEATGRGRGGQELALLFTDLVGFSSWALKAGDTAVLALLREVGEGVEEALEEHRGRIVKRLGDGLMATFLDPRHALAAALDAQDALAEVEVEGYRPRMRVGLHWGRPRRLGGDLLGVDVNIAARVADAAKGEQTLASEALLDRVDRDGIRLGKRKRLRAPGAPRDFYVIEVTRSG